MAFNNFGFGTLASGETARWWYRFTDGADFGAQYCMVHPLNPGGSIVVNDQTKRRENDGTITYVVSMRNEAGVPTNFSLSGGGLS
jgi:hypothetical protein